MRPETENGINNFNQVPKIPDGLTEQELDNFPLPDGSNESDFLSQNRSWKGLRESRQGKSRIEREIVEKNNPCHIAFIKHLKKHKDNPKIIKFFEAGPGHGNDLRYVMKLYKNITNLSPEINIASVGYSSKEFEEGFEIHGDDSVEKRQMLFQGNLCDLNNIKAYNQETEKWDIDSKIINESFGIIHMEAVLHALGFGKKTYNEKKKNALNMLKELFRICQHGGIIFGRANVFGKSKDGSELSKREQIEELWKPDLSKNSQNNWRFYPTNIKEFDDMMNEVGFKKIILNGKIRKRVKESRKFINKVSFLYMKPPIDEEFENSIQE